MLAPVSSAFRIFFLNSLTFITAFSMTSSAILDEERSVKVDIMTESSEGNFSSMPSDFVSSLNACKRFLTVPTKPSQVSSMAESRLFCPSSSVLPMTVVNVSAWRETLLQISSSSRKSGFSFLFPILHLVSRIKRRKIFFADARCVEERRGCEGIICVDEAALCNILKEILLLYKKIVKYTKIFFIKLLYIFDFCVKI